MEKKVIRLCNRCNAEKTGNARCEVCGCPEFRMEVEREKDRTSNADGSTDSRR